MPILDPTLNAGVFLIHCGWLTAPQMPTCHDAHSGSWQLSVAAGLVDKSQYCSLSFSSSPPMQVTSLCFIPFPQVTRHWWAETDLKYNKHLTFLHIKTQKCIRSKELSFNIIENLLGKPQQSLY